MSLPFSDADRISIAFVIGGKWVRLSSPARWSQAVRSGDLTAETPVEIEVGGHVVHRGRAKDIPQLAAILEQATPRSQTPAPSPESPAEADVDGVGEASEPPAPAQRPVRSTAPRPVVVAKSQAPIAAAPTRTVAQIARASQKPDPPATQQTTSRPGPPKRDTNTGWIWTVGAVLVVLLLVGWCTRPSPGPTDTLYVRADALAYPSQSSDQQGRPLARGDVLIVAQDPAGGSPTPWAKIAAGAHRDEYVRREVLSSTAPPALLEQSGRDTQVAVRAAAARAEPSDDADLIQRLPRSRVMHVVGMTASGWAEVLLDENRPAYVRDADLNPRISDSAQPAAPAVSTPAPGAATPALQRYVKPGPARAPVAEPPPPPPEPEPVADPAPAPLVVTNPDWSRKPTGEDMARYYPDRAQRMNVEGRAVLSCIVAVNGSLVGCQVVSESPNDYGFGLAALQMSRLFKMRPTSDDGRPVGGATVRIPVSFRLPRG